MSLISHIASFYSFYIQFPKNACLSLDGRFWHAANTGRFPIANHKNKISEKYYFLKLRSVEVYVSSQPSCLRPTIIGCSFKNVINLFLTKRSLTLTIPSKWTPKAAGITFHASLIKSDAKFINTVCNSRSSINVDSSHLSLHSSDFPPLINFCFNQRLDRAIVLPL